MYIVNIRIPDDLKGKVKINLPEQIKIRETKEKTLKVKKQSVSLLKLNH